MIYWLLASLSFKTYDWSGDYRWIIGGVCNIRECNTQVVGAFQEVLFDIKSFENIV